MPDENGSPLRVFFYTQPHTALTFKRNLKQKNCIFVEINQDTPGYIIFILKQNIWQESKA